MPFIVLEGLDGAGKSTQIEMLKKMLEERGITYRYLHFPRFDAPVFGELIARFLRGELGCLDQVNPYLVALIYACDRADAAKQIREWIAAGEFVVVDRYVYSNIGYQCAKLPEGEVEKLKEWILDLEYGYYNLPRPDINIFLDVPFKFTESRLTADRDGDDRGYLKGSADIHEASLDLQRRVREIYLAAAEKDSNLKVVNCSDAHGNMAAPEANFAKIAALIEKLI